MHHGPGEHAVAKVVDTAQRRMDVSWVCYGCAAPNDPQFCPGALMPMFQSRAARRGDKLNGEHIEIGDNFSRVCYGRVTPVTLYSVQEMKDRYFNPGRHGGSIS